jgi:NTE family protein
MSPKTRQKLALVLAGGGARGAYEAGVLHYIRTMLPIESRSRQFDIHCGASVGAINTCFMVATAHDHQFQGQEMRRLWENLKEENIYRRNVKALLGFLSKSGKGMFLNLFRGVREDAPHFPGFLDTEPFMPFIEKAFSWKMISKNIQSAVVQALSIVATNVFTGRMELFIEKNSNVDYTGEADAHFTRIQPVHARASASIPIVFPSVLINGIAYTDGGLRLNTPLSPAIQLGADAIFVIGLNHRARPGEKIPFHGEKGKPPALGQVLGRVMNAVFLDKIQYDMEQLERINRMIDWGEMLYGKDFLGDLNQMLKKKNIRGDVANRGVKRLKVLRIRPSQDVGELFSHTFQHAKNKHFTSFEKFLIRILDVDPKGGVDFLSYIAFMPEYLKTLLDLGFEDARRHHEALKEFLEQ